MNINIKNQGSKLKMKIENMRQWMNDHRLPPRVILILMGILSTIWFLIRVIPKPSRATYPCMRVAAPLMSGFIVYLLSLGGIALALKKAKQSIYKARYFAAITFIVVALIGMVFTLMQGSQKLFANVSPAIGPDDGPNQPMGIPTGIKPGRVVWVWDSTATNRNFTDYFFNPANTNQKVVSNMLDESIKKLTQETTVAKSWDSMFRYFNTKKHNENRGYKAGEKIFIKINQTSGRGKLTAAVREKGNYSYPSQQTARSANIGVCETGPNVVLQVLRQLVNECGIPQSDIAVGDPQNPTYAHNYEAWHAEFPDVKYTDRTFGTFGRTLIKATENDLLFYSDKYETDKLYDIIENADYMINVANMKPHLRSGITLTAKNHFGSQSRTGAYHLHYSHVSPIVEARPTNGGYKKYRVFVDLMGSKYLGRNTILFVVDGLFSGGAGEGGPPVKYFMTPFNGDWTNSIFVSQDQVALESVCYDFLRTEWNGTYKHDASNNRSEIMPGVNGVDDYLHQAADPSNWPEGIVYDPDKSGEPLTSLGVHEHWNDPVTKQYSRNMGKSYGIEFVSIPENIVGPAAAKMVTQKSTGSLPVKPETIDLQTESKDIAPSLPASSDVNSSTPKITSVVKRELGDPKPKRFYGAVSDDNNGKLFLTDLGIIGGFSFNTLYENPKIPSGNIRSLIYALTGFGPALWMATNTGAIAATLPISNTSPVNVYSVANSEILSDNVQSIAKGRDELYWIGTDKGISAIHKDKWLKPDYQRKYPVELFTEFPVTSMETTHDGDSLYVGTVGAGVIRVFRNEVDGISGASEYAQWGPIEMPSDTVYSICIAKDQSQWIGTSQGVGKHEGFVTMEKWTVYNTTNGLINNTVQCIAEDSYGNIWCGTKGGISIFDGTAWTSFTTKDGLISDNITFINVDLNSTVYIGTDNGIMVYSNSTGQLTCYQ